ncbi:recombinase family protein [Salinimonas lutimaris]|uniref:recombinase family protein n=1 Tax=Salinimonas lutimaris TaxID=914153 RepID=UPI0010BF7BEE|nr:recombinase family protein [Salinimonas lutimaris]
MGDLVGFARVSTQHQDLKIQREKLSQYGCKKIFESKHSGKAETNKKALEELLGYVRAGDTVVVTKLDRLGRSLTQVLTTLDLFKERGVTFTAIDQNNIDTTKDDPMSKAMLHLLGVFAEMERNFIVERTTEGKIASGNFGGRKPKLSEETRSLIIDSLKGGASKRQLALQYGVSRGTIINIAKQAQL